MAQPPETRLYGRFGLFFVGVSHGKKSRGRWTSQRPEDPEATSWPVATEPPAAAEDFKATGEKSPQKSPQTAHFVLFMVLSPTFLTSRSPFFGFLSVEGS